MFTDAHIPDAILRILILGPVSLIWIVSVVRMIGLRSFSKMTAFDFITTVATGSLLANSASASTWTDFIVSNAAMLTLLCTQAFFARMRVRSVKWIGAIENEPILLMRDGTMLRENMRKTRVAEADLRAKLREANVLEYSQIRAVVLETTGDISVLHGSGLEQELLESVRETG